MTSMVRCCEQSGATFEISSEDLAFYGSIGPTFAGIHFPVPPPRLCPEERLRRRLAFRNERHFYRSTCDITGKPIISIFSPDKGLKVCDRRSWYTIDNTEFGRDFDFSRPFFEQFGELYRETWKANVVHSGEMENSDYSHFAGDCKNCYFMFDAGQIQDCCYGVFVGYSRDCYDSLYLVNSELCYETVKVENGYRLLFSLRCKGCSFSAFLRDCIGCSNCIGCMNLRNKEYYAFNEFVGKEKFDELWNETFCGSYSALENMRRRFEGFQLTQPHRALNNLNTLNSSGDDLTDCENVLDSYNVIQAKNCRFLHDCYFNVERTYDVNGWGEGMEGCLELTGSGGLMGKVGIAGCMFSTCIYYGGYNVLYSLYCYEKSQDLFGCCDLVKKQYCILNKQYTREEYNELVPRIIEHMRKTGEWGEFFPVQLSLFGYNETVAQELMPLTRDEALARSVNWSDYEAPITESQRVHQTESLADNIDDVNDGILNEAVICSISKRPFRLVAPELQFYRKMRLPLPRLHFYERHNRRLSLLNPRRLWRRRCAKTGREIYSSYSPERPEIVYCEEAYQEVVK